MRATGAAMTLVLLAMAALGEQPGQWLALVVLATASGVLLGWRSRVPVAAPAPWPALLGTVGPVWARHLDNARAQGGSGATDALNALEQMLQTLDAAGMTDPQRSEQRQAAATELMQYCRAQLEPLVETVETALAQKRESNLLVADLAQAAQSLQGLVNEVASIARQIGLVSLNAAIEAARAGQHGRGFAVVAAEVRELATRSNQIAQDIAGGIRAVSQKGDAAIDAQHAGAARDAALTGVIRAGVESTLERVDAVVSDAHAEAEETQRQALQLQDALSSMMVAMQFQDRVSQMIELVSRDVVRMTGAVGACDDDAVPAPDAWLQRLRSEYTMPDEEATHHGAPAATPAARNGAVFF